MNFAYPTFKKLSKYRFLLISLYLSNINCGVLEVGAFEVPNIRVYRTSVTSLFALVVFCRVKNSLKVILNEFRWNQKMLKRSDLSTAIVSKWDSFDLIHDFIGYKD